MNVLNAKITILTGSWEDRWSTIEDTKKFLEDVGHEVKIYNGFHASHNDINSVNRLGKGHVGCILSTMALMDNTEDVVGIFESDAVINCNKDQYIDVLSHAPDCDILYLFATDASWYDSQYKLTDKRTNITNISKSWWYLQNPLNTTAVFYSRRAVECIRKSMHLKLPLDRMVTDVANKYKLKWGITDLVLHGDFGSKTFIDSGK